MNERARDRSRPSSHEQREQPAGQRLEQVLADIREDAGVRPREYLRDTVVPEGGE